jgi:hypothetical protein
VCVPHHRTARHRLHDVHPHLEDGRSDLLKVRQSCEEKLRATQVSPWLREREREREGQRQTEVSETNNQCDCTYSEQASIKSVGPGELKDIASQLRIIVGDTGGGHIGYLLSEGVSSLSWKGDRVAQVVVNIFRASRGGKAKKGYLDWGGFVSHHLQT